MTEKYWTTKHLHNLTLSEQLVRTNAACPDPFVSRTREALGVAESPHGPQAPGSSPIIAHPPLRETEISTDGEQSHNMRWKIVSLARAVDGLAMAPCGRWAVLRQTLTQSTMGMVIYSEEELMLAYSPLLFSYLNRTP